MIRFGNPASNRQAFSNVGERPEGDGAQMLTLSPLKRVVMLSSPLFGPKKNKNKNNTYGVVESDDESSIGNKNKDIHDGREGFLKGNHKKNVGIADSRLERLERSIDKMQPSISQLEQSIDQLLLDLSEGKDDEDDSEPLPPPSGEFTVGSPSSSSSSSPKVIRRRRKPRSLKKSLEMDLSKHIMSPRRQARSSNLTYLPASLSPKTSPSSKPKLKFPRGRVVLQMPNVTDDEKNDQVTSMERMAKSDHVSLRRHKSKNGDTSESLRLCSTSHDILAVSPRRRKTTTQRRSSLADSVESVSKAIGNDNGQHSPVERMVKSDHVALRRKSKKGASSESLRLCNSSHNVLTASPRRRKTTRRRTSLGASVEAVSVTLADFKLDFSPKDTRPSQKTAPKSSSLSPKKSPRTPVRSSRRKVKTNGEGSISPQLSPNSALAKMGKQLHTLHEIAADPPLVPPLAEASPKISPRIVRPRRRNSLRISIYDSPKESTIATREAPPLSRAASDGVQKKTQVPKLVRAVSDSDVMSVSSAVQHRRVLARDGDEDINDDMPCRPYLPNYSASAKNTENEHDSTAWVPSPSGHRRHLEINF